MKHLLSLFGMFVAMGFMTAQQEPAAPKKGKAPVPAAGQVSPGIRFNPTAQAIVGAGGDALAIALSADGKRLASVGGSFNPSSGFLSVLDMTSKKELQSIRLPRPYQSVDISPDGMLVALASQAGDLKLMEVETGKTLFSKKLDGSAQVAFTADGQSLATVTQAKSVQIWDVPSGEEQSKFRGATVPLRSIAISPDGKKLAAGGGEQQKKAEGSASGTIYIWDLVSQRLLHKVETGEPFQITNLAFSSDSKLLAGVSADFQIRVWELEGAKLKNSIAAQQQMFGLAFSPSGTLAGATGNGFIRLWDAATGEELGNLIRHNGPCRCVAFTEKGKKLVSGGSGRSIKLWDVANKKELAVLHEDERNDEAPIPLAMAAAKDGSLIAVTTEDKGIILRDGSTGAVKATLKGHEDAVVCVAFSPDGKTLATGSTDKTIKLWDVRTGKDRATLKGHTNWVYCLAFSRDGKTLASGSYDKSIRIWDVETGDAKDTIQAHRGSVRAVAFSPDGKTIVSGGNDRFVKAWNVEDGAMKFAAKGHEGSVRSLAFSLDGKTLASGGEDGFVKFWNPVSGKELSPGKKANDEEVTALAFTSERTLISGGANGSILQWDSIGGEMIGNLQGHNGGVSGLALVAGDRELITAGLDGVLKRFRRDAPGPIRLFTGHTGVIQTVAFSPDGMRFVSCGNWPEGDKTLRVWDIQKGVEIFKIDHPGQAPNARFTPNGKYIASTSGNTNAYLWDATTGELVRTFKGHTAAVNGLAFNADGSKMLTSSADRTVRLWDTETARELQKFTGHTDTIRRVIFHPDGKHALSAGRDGFVRMWELETAVEVNQFSSMSKWADCVAVSKDGKFLATAGQTILVYEIESGKKVAECAGHTAGVTHVAFSDDGKRLLSASYDFSARLWDRTSGKELYKFLGHREMLWSAEFTPDGKGVITAGGGIGTGDGKWAKGSDHAVRLWKMPDEKAMAEFSSEN